MSDPVFQPAQINNKPLPPLFPSTNLNPVNNNNRPLKNTGIIKGPGIDFIFDVVGDGQFNFSSDITDHYCEDLTFLHDHIGVKPYTITLKGYVGELIHKNNDQFPPKITKYVQKLNTIEQLLPEMLPGAYYAQQTISRSLYLTDMYSEAKNNANNYMDVLRTLWGDKVPNTLGAFPNQDNPFYHDSSAFKDRQTKAFYFLNYLLAEKAIVEVDTPWGHFDNMAIETLISKQGENSKYITDFSITLKQIRALPEELKTVPFDPTNFQSRAAMQREPEVNNGKAQGRTVSEEEKSILYDLYQYSRNTEIPLAG